jgi:hypothetical protein
MCDRTKLLDILAGVTGGAVAIEGMEAWRALRSSDTEFFSARRRLYFPARIAQDICRRRWSSDGTEFDLRTLLPHDGIVPDWFMSAIAVAEALEPPLRR